MKTLVIAGAVVGSYAGSFIPLLWGGSVLSVSSLLLGAVGGFAGIFLGYKLAERMGLS